MQKMSKEAKNAAISLIHKLLHKKRQQIMRHRDVAEAVTHMVTQNSVQYKLHGKGVEGSKEEMEKKAAEWNKTLGPNAQQHGKYLVAPINKKLREAREDDIEDTIKGYDREQQRTLRRDDLDPRERHARAARLLKRMARLKARRDDLKAK